MIRSLLVSLFQSVVTVDSQSHIIPFLVEEILLRTEPATLQKTYGLPDFSNTLEFLTMLALSSGRLLKVIPPIISARQAVF